MERKVVTLKTFEHNLINILLNKYVYISIISRLMRHYVLIDNSFEKKYIFD